MEALIIDDEKHVREAIRLLVDWERHGIATIYEAQDGKQAIELLSARKPQIVMTDMMMPRLDGTGVMEWISRHAPACKVIAISGHDDFALVRHTLQHGGMDYILKPIDPEAINAAVSKAVEAWRHDEEERQARHMQRMQVNEFKPLVSEKLWSSLLDDPAVYEANVRRLSLEFGLPAGISRIRLAIACVPAGSREFRGKFGDDVQLLFYTLVNIAADFLNPPGRMRGAAFRYWSTGSELAIVLWEDAAELEAVLQRINAGLAQTVQRKLHFGTSGSQPFPAGLNAAYVEAKAALARRNLMQAGIEVHPFPGGTEPGEAAAAPVRLSAAADDWALAAQSGQADQLAAAVRRWSEPLRSRGVLTPAMRAQCLKEWEAIRTRLVQDAAPDSGTASDLIGRLEAEDPLRQLADRDSLTWEEWERHWLEALQRLSDALSAQQGREQHIIFDIARYVDQHYNEDLSLQDMAQRFYVSREYISRKFKQQFGINLSDYWTGIRIEKAKRLLLNPHLRIAQVGEMVGYQDEKYFSKVFKKVEGVSPNTYRKQHDGS